MGACFLLPAGRHWESVVECRRVAGFSGYSRESLRRRVLRMQVEPVLVVPKPATAAAVAAARVAAQNAAAYSRVSRAVLFFGLSVATLALARYLRPSVSKREDASSVQPVSHADDGKSHRISEELGDDGKKNVLFITPSTLRLSEVIPLVESDSCGVRICGRWPAVPP